MWPTFHFQLFTFSFSSRIDTFIHLWQTIHHDIASSNWVGWLLTGERLCRPISDFISSVQHLRRIYIMSKNHDAKKDDKKKPTKTLKEKRQEKKAKKEAK
jgi:hypothetical protein